MSQHTPGPWKLVTGNKFRQFHAIAIREEFPAIKGSQQTFASVRGNGHEESLANARLIAAAPELLEALLTARDHIDMDALEISHCKDAAQIRAAIAKATREQA